MPNPFGDATNFQINQNHIAQRLQQDQLQGILDVLAGKRGLGQHAKGVASILQGISNNSRQSLLDARNQAIQDTKGLNAAAVRDFETSILPQIQGAAEGAGASASALTALLAQKAGIDSAANVAKLQGAQILGQERLVNQANIAQEHDQTQLISTLLGQLLSQANRGGISTPSISPNAFTTISTPTSTFQGNPMDTLMHGGGFVGPQDHNTGYTPIRRR